MTILETIGLLFIVSIVGFIIFSLILLIGVYLTLKRKSYPGKKFILFIVNYLSPILAKILKIINKEKDFCELIIKYYNKYYEKYKKGKKILFLPHCLRSLKCPARLSNIGVLCVSCGLCTIKDILKLARQKNYLVYIVPGSTFVKRIIKEIKPTYVFGVACYRDLFEVMNALSKKGLPVGGVLLEKDGCVETIVDLEKLKVSL